MRRSLKTLEQAVAEATTDAARASACYELGVFHDNNSREAEAIPCYEQALAFGLGRRTGARALAWLASSLYKTNRASEAWRRSEQALERPTMQT